MNCDMIWLCGCVSFHSTKKGKIIWGDSTQSRRWNLSIPDSSTRSTEVTVRNILHHLSIVWISDRSFECSRNLLWLMHASDVVHICHNNIYHITVITISSSWSLMESIEEEDRPPLSEWVSKRWNTTTFTSISLNTIIIIDQLSFNDIFYWE